MENQGMLAQAILNVMREVKGIEKNSRIGTGASAYDGVKDQDVKEIFNEVMVKYGLCILPIEITENTQIERWEEEDFYNGKSKGKRMKQSIFTKVVTKYKLLHESGESCILTGYGHGIDSQDKSAGKATTYALKYCLLYTFLTPVGKIDDTDMKHSDNIPTPEYKNYSTITAGHLNNTISTQLDGTKEIIIIKKDTDKEDIKEHLSYISSLEELKICFNELNKKNQQEYQYLFTEKRKQLSTNI